MTRELGTYKVSIAEPEFATPCLICGKAVIIWDPHSYPVVCDECKRAVELVKSLYKNKPCWTCKDFTCGCCTNINQAISYINIGDENVIK